MKFLAVVLTCCAFGCSSPTTTNIGGDAGADSSDSSVGDNRIYTFADTYVVFEAAARAYCQCDQPDNFSVCLDGFLGPADSRVRAINGCTEEANRSDPDFNNYLECQVAAYQAFLECNQACAGECRYERCPSWTPSARAENASQNCIFDRFAGSTPSVCPSNEVPSSALGESVFTGTTLLMGDDFSPPDGCSPDNRPSADVAFQWTAPSTGVFAINVHGVQQLLGREMDTVLYVQAGCDGAPIVCGDETGGSASVRGPSRVTLGATQGVTYTIVVDTFVPQDAGEFIVSINPAP